MEGNVEMEAIIWLILGIMGAALMAGGIVAYRGSGRTGVRASGAAAFAAGVVMCAIVAVTIPALQVQDQPPQPIIELSTTEVEQSNLSPFFDRFKIASKSSEESAIFTTSSILVLLP